YALIGAAMLCKQNFALLAPTSVLILGDARRPAAWLAAAAPALLYAGGLWAAGALPAAAAQLGTQTDPIHNGVLSYLATPWLYAGLVLGYVSIELTLRRALQEPGMLAALGLAAACATLLAAAATMDRDDYFYLHQASFLIFGLTLGAAARELRPRGPRASGL